MAMETFDTILAQLEGIDDLRLTIAGAGDPLLHPHLPEVLKRIDGAGIPAVHIETDLVSLDDAHLDALAASRVDVLTLHLPAVTPATYQQVMGIDAVGIVIDNLKRVLARRGALPLVVPTFTKCRANLAEMEAWYDHWLRVLGVAVIAGPSDYAGQIPDHGCADMSPPRRRACARINSRMTFLADGTIPSCEQDVLGREPVGHAVGGTIAGVWRDRFPILRAEHQTRALCASCKEWHRP
jgi:MoaA/NifB/PqqE/SkfB family radical SAM enzyme